MKVFLGVSASFVVGLAALVGCGSDSDSEINALSSNDWFKKGVDRFYLAYRDAGEQIHPNYSYRQGERFLLGLGCYGEPKDPKALVKVTSKDGSENYIPLNERVALNQFPVVSGDERPENGQCKIILGSATVARKILAEDLDEGGNKDKVVERLAGSALGCFAMVATSTKFIGTALAGGYATAQTGGIAAPLAIPAVVAEGAGVITSGFYCVLKTKETVAEVATFQVAENKKLFSQTMDAASTLAAQKLSLNGSLELYNELVNTLNPDKIAVASAIWNKELVRSFNKDINDTFENGWGKGTKFFDAVAEVETEILEGAETFSK